MKRFLTIFTLIVLFLPSFNYAQNSLFNSLWVDIRPGCSKQSAQEILKKKGFTIQSGSTKDALIYAKRGTGRVKLATNKGTVDYIVWSSVNIEEGDMYTLEKQLEYEDNCLPFYKKDSLYPESQRERSGYFHYYKSKEKFVFLIEYYLNHSWWDHRLILMTEEAAKKEIEGHKKATLREQEKKKEREMEEYNRRTRNESKYEELLLGAETFYNLKKYEKTKECYITALRTLDFSLLGQTKKENIISKLEEVNKILDFLEQRKSYFDFTKFPEYKSKLSIIEKLINDNLADNSNIIEVNVHYTIDTTKKQSVVVTTKGGKHDGLRYDIQNELAKNPFEQPYMYDYTVPVEVEYKIPVYIEEEKLWITKKNRLSVYPSVPDCQIQLLPPKAPWGEYTVKFISRTINKKDFSSVSLTDYKGYGGPSCALLSMLLPGLGDWRVSYGEKTGLGKACLYIGLVGSSIYCKKQSNEAYNQYHYEYNKQKEMDVYFRRAQNNNIASLCLLGTAACIWTYDVMYCFFKGCSNKVEQRRFKNQYISMSFDTYSSKPYFNYCLNF